jgi:hypothetical protein
MQRYFARSALAFVLTAALGASSAQADGSYGSDYYDYGYGDDGGYYDEGSGSSGYYDGAEIYYENQYGADNAYDLYFYRTLSPYGEWILLRGVGYVWRPFIRNAWSPYSLGYWGWSRNLWTWISYEPFGYVVYHYGNWGYMDGYGWCWFPGYRWAPHHVQWSSWNGYIGWAPRPPRVHGHGYRFRRPEEHYTWVANRRFLDRDVHRHRVSPSEVWRGSRRPSNLPVLTSPTRTLAERWTGRRPEEVNLERVNRRTRRGVLELFVPDRQTRDQVRRQSRDVVRPWLDEGRIRDSVRRERQVRERDSGSTSPWRRDRSAEEERERRRGSEDRRSSEDRRDRGARHSDGPATTPWGGARRERDGSRSSPPAEVGVRPRGEERSERSPGRGGRDDRRGSEGRESDSRGSDRPSRAWKGRRADESKKADEKKADERKADEKKADEKKADEGKKDRGQRGNTVSGRSGSRRP